MAYVLLAIPDVTVDAGVVVVVVEPGVVSTGSKHAITCQRYIHTYH